MRTAKIERKTTETDLVVEINLDGKGVSAIDTGIGFFDHMLELLAFHSQFDLKISCTGDLKVDDHHTVEDIGIALGQGFRQALGIKKGIRRYAHCYLPMDEALSLVVIDISNRPYLVFDVDFKAEKVGIMCTQNFKEFFQAFANQAGLTLHIKSLYGENDHHRIEAIFKGFARALREAVEIVSTEIPSSKGVL